MPLDTGFLLVNLGTPDSPAPKDVGRYLRQFLMDPFVIDIPWPARFFLVHALIVPGRSKSSGKLYEKVWTRDGSPLLKLSRDLEEAVRRRLPDVPVELGMRYGNPSLDESFVRLRLARPSIKKLVVLSLYPQYSLAATASCEAEVKAAAKRAGFTAELKFIRPFYDDSMFLDAFADRIGRTLGEGPWDKLVFSYHGLPERQVKRTAPRACQFTESCCAAITEANRDCYRAQCFETSRRLASLLGIAADKHVTAFQSRLGRTPWIKPHSDVLYTELPKQGFKRVVVTSPSFVADCLETLEEIAIRGKESFLENGGESLRLVPSLNATPKWVDTVVGLYQKESDS